MPRGGMRMIDAVVVEVRAGFEWRDYGRVRLRWLGGGSSQVRGT